MNITEVPLHIQTPQQLEMLRTIVDAAEPGLWATTNTQGSVRIVTDSESRLVRIIVWQRTLAGLSLTRWEQYPVEIPDWLSKAVAEPNATPASIRDAAENGEPTPSMEGITSDHRGIESDDEWPSDPGPTARRKTAG